MGTQRTFRGIRSDLGLTQQEMAEKLGVTITTYQHYERYLSRIPAEILFKVAELGHVDPSTIRIK